MGDGKIDGILEEEKISCLPLLSRRQAARQLWDNEKRITLSSTASDDFTDIIITNNPKRDHGMMVDLDDNNSQTMDDDSDKPLNDEDQPSGKMNVSKQELMFLLSVLKSELQSKEVALAAIKYEQLKRLMNPVEISRSSLANAYIQLQDRLKQPTNKQIKTKTTSTTLTTTRSNKVIDTVNSKENLSENEAKEANTDDESFKRHETQSVESSEKEKNDHESLNILNALLELLDRHPLLALPRDSIYCLDFNCNELSTKNYLNLKIQHLDNLISQHRHYRYLMNERLRKCEQRSMDLSDELAKERCNKAEKVRELCKKSERVILLRHIEELATELEGEKTSKQILVMTLVSDLRKERAKIKRLKEKRSKANDTDIVAKLRSELLDKEQEIRIKQKEFEDEKSNLIKRVQSLELENSKLKTQLTDEKTPTKSTWKVKKTSTQSSPSSATKTNTTPITKPQVPAKPAQLLDQARNLAPK